MYKLFAIFLIASMASESMAMSHRLRRQAVTSSTTAAAPIAAAQPSSGNGQNITMEQCLLGCPVTPEYNPVCGSNGVTYSNPGRLLCAQACGESEYR
ncbi:hypothetical protein RR46_13219 [Papilio xuthus]|uniref:Kazal-like domain-containing protein n=1 Tax=Papilio xuthus TaxID=66420 RepID=A0A194PMU2_PAPXU|nr:hypothetical protein RR46_13219 [Papilio xuthus]